MGRGQSAPTYMRRMAATRSTSLQDKATHMQLQKNPLGPRHTRRLTSAMPAGAMIAWSKPILASAVMGWPMRAGKTYCVASRGGWDRCECPLRLRRGHVHAHATRRLRMLVRSPPLPPPPASARGAHPVQERKPVVAHWSADGGRVQAQARGACYIILEVRPAGAGACCCGAAHARVMVGGLRDAVTQQRADHACGVRDEHALGER